MDRSTGQVLSRREFAKALTLAAGGISLPSSLVAGLPGQPERRLRVGHTGITWGFSPEDADEAIQDIGSLGYQGFESFGNVLEAWEARGGLGQVLEAANLPLRSAYCPVNLTDAEVRAGEVDKLVRWGKLIRKYGGIVAVIGPNNVRRDSYELGARRSNIIAALNDMGKALMDIGVVGALHPHTGTCVETAEEARIVMEAVDTRYVRFGPDVGQLEKAGSDPIPLVRDFASVIQHVHLKDYNGGPEFLGYAPLGRGRVNVPEIVELLEGSDNDLMIMVELDPNERGRPMPMTPLETARISREYLRSLGYTFLD